MAIQEALKILAEFDDQASPQIKALNAQLEEVNKGVEKVGDTSEKSTKKVNELAKGAGAAKDGVGSLGKTADTTGKKVQDLGNKATQASAGGLAGLRSLIRNLSFDFRAFAQGGEAALGAATELAGSGASALGSALLGVGAGATAAATGLTTAAKATSTFNDEALQIAVTARRIVGSQREVQDSINASNRAIYALAKGQGFSRNEAKDFTSAISKQAEVLIRTETPLKAIVSLIKSFGNESRISGAVSAGAFARIGAEIQTAARAAASFVGTFAKGVGLGLGATLALVEGIAVGVRSAADNAAELADKLGITVERMETLSLLANENGGSIQGLVSVYDRLSKSLNKLDADNKKAEESFAALGIQQKDLAGKSETEIAGIIIKNYELLGRTTEATAAVQQLLGQSFREQIPSIKEASDNFGDYEERVRKYGATTTPELIAAGGRQEQALSNLGLAFKGLGIQIAGFASESITEIAQFTADAIKALKDTGAVGKVIQVVYQTVAILFANVSFVLKGVGRELGGIAAQLVSLAKLDFKGFTAIGDAVKEDAKAARAELDALEQRILNPQARVGTQGDVRGVDNALAAKAAEEAAIKAAAAEAKLASQRRLAAEEQQKLYASAKEELESQIRLSGELTNAERVLAETIDGKYSKFSAQQKQELLNLAQKLDIKEKQLELDKQLKDIEDDLNAQAAALTMAELEVSLAGKSVELREKELDLAKELATVRKASAGLSATQREDLETYVRTLNERRAALRIAQQEAEVVNQLLDNSEAAINSSIQKNVQIAKKLLEEGKISVLDYTTFVQDQLQRVKTANEEAASESSLFWQEAAKGIQSALSNFFFDVMQGKLTNLADSFKRTLDQMVANALAAKLADALFGGGFANGKSGANLGGYVGQFVDFLSGVFGREKGGPVRAGVPYIVGEKRAELFVPDQAGTIVPSLEGLQSAGTNITFAISAMDSQDVIRSIDKVSRQVANIVNGASGKYNLQGVR